MGAFNCARELGPTVSSVLGQTGCDLELIVVNDGSTDDTARLLNELGETDGRLRVIHQQNSGLTRALIAGCAAARAPLISTAHRSSGRGGYFTSWPPAATM
jgi:glycosyltransferase involved in cell wall biosynthesis